jgi:hypothetical protein
MRYSLLKKNWPNEVDLDDVAVVNIGLIYFDHLDDAILVGAAKVSEYNFCQLSQ